METGVLMISKGPETGFCVQFQVTSVWTIDYHNWLLPQGLVSVKTIQLINAKLFDEV